MDSVLIVGAGPVGLSLGLALARQGRPVTVIDQRPSIPTDFRATTVQPLVLEMLQEWGVLPAAIQVGKQVHSYQVWDWTRPRKLADIDYLRIAGDTPCPYRLHIPQAALCRILREALEQLQPGAVRWGHKALSVEDRGDRVRLTAGTRDKEVVALDGRWLCAADGLNSAIRKQMQIAFDGPEHSESFVVAHADSSAMRIMSERAGERLAPVSCLYLEHDWAMVMEMVNHVRLLFHADSEQGPEAVATEAMTARAKTLLGGEGEIQSTGMYRVSLRLASTLRAGRILLAGDAAHSGYPVDGTAMNTGILDAHHLARAIGEETDEALDDYDATRRAWARRYLLADTARSMGAMEAHWPWTRLARNLSVTAGANTPAKERSILLRASLLGERTGGS